MTVSEPTSAGGRWRLGGARFWIIVLAIWALASGGTVWAAWLQHDWKQLASAAIVPLVFLQGLGNILLRRSGKALPDLSDANATYRLTTSRIVLTASLIGAIGFAVCFYVAWDRQTNVFPLDDGILWLPAMAIMAGAAVIRLIQLIAYVPYLDLSPAGLACPACFAGTLPWADIGEVKLRRRLNMTYMTLELREPIVVGAPWQRGLLRCIGVRGPLKSRVPLNGPAYGVDTERLYRAIDQRIAVLGMF